MWALRFQIIELRGGKLRKLENDENDANKKAVRCERCEGHSRALYEGTRAPKRLGSPQMDKLSTIREVGGGRGTTGGHRLYEGRHTRP